MKNTVFGILIFFGALMLGAFLERNHIGQPPMTLSLPEEICQAGKGDHMRIRVSNDTAYLEYSFDRNGKLKDDGGQQYTIANDLNYKDTASITTPEVQKQLIDLFRQAVKKQDSTLKKKGAVK